MFDYEELAERKRLKTISVDIDVVDTDSLREWYCKNKTVHNETAAVYKNVPLTADHLIMISNLDGATLAVKLSLVAHILETYNTHENRRRKNGLLGLVSLLGLGMMASIIVIAIGILTK